MHQHFHQTLPHCVQRDKFCSVCVRAGVYMCGVFGFTYVDIFFCKISLQLEMFVAWLCLLGTVYSAVGEDSCVYQDGCTCSDDDIYCSNLGLTDLPVPVGTGVVDTLNLDWNSIISLPAERLPPKIHYLSIMFNPVKSIDDSAFDNSLDTLLSLSFSRAKFTTIPNAMGRLQKLQTLYITDTRIVDWNPDAMKNIGASLDSLLLEGCNMMSWPQWLTSFNNLIFLSFASNYISSIPDNGFDSLASTLSNLDLRNNSLTSIPKAMFTMSALQMLQLSENKISNVTWLPPTNKLTRVLIDNNQLFDVDQLSRALLPHASFLEELVIHSNYFTSLPNVSFLTNVQNMDFEFNHLSDPNSGSFPLNINSVGLSNNRLPSIPKVLMTLRSSSRLSLDRNSLTQIRDFEIPPWTVSADFGYNLITELTDNSFPPNCSLMFLDINNNPLRKISSQAFRNVQGLSLLNLMSTKLTRLPLALFYVKGLTSVDFSGSEDLVCTCNEKELSPWIASLNEYAISGDCGKTTIFEFYSVLALGCPS